MSWVLGIDLGTSFTAAGLASGDRLEPIALGAHSSAIPSAVYQGDSGPLVGDAALIRGDANPTRLVVEFKRQLGESEPILAGDEFVSAEDLERELGLWVFERACELEGSVPEQVVSRFRRSGARIAAMSS
jgi:molecular chaperone DnaK (HSP70)